MLLQKHRNHAAPAAHDVAVAGATETRVLSSSIGVGLNKHFLGAKLGGAVKIRRIHRFVRTQRQHSMHALVDGRIDYVAAAHDVGLNGFERIVFAGWNLFERGGMNHNSYAG